MLSQRRKQKSAETPEVEVSAAPAKTKKSGKKKVEGPLRSIALGRKYREHEVSVEDDGTLALRSVFDPQGRSASAIDEEISKDRVVNSAVFLEHINETVFRAVFGVPLRRKIARLLLDGISDQCLVLTEQGYKIKLPNLVTMERVQRASRKARNPRTGEEVTVPARAALSAKATRSARAYMAES